MPNASQFSSHEEYLEWYRKYRLDNIEKFREYHRIHLRGWRKKYGTHRDKARGIVFRALRSGKIEKKPCRRCGSLQVQAHHTDYDKPLKIIWLCVPHHKEADRKMKKISTASG